MEQGSIRTFNPCLSLLAQTGQNGYKPWVVGKEVGRGKRIRTSGPCLPKTVLYQAELFPDRCRNRFVGGPVRQEWAYRQGFPGWQAGNDVFLQ